MVKDSTKKQKNDDTMSLADVITIQENLKKDIDFDKPDEELTPAEQVIKAFYHSLDEAVEKSMGKEAKKDFDKKRKTMEMISKFQVNIHKLSELGKEIEKNFVLQRAYFINHFEKNENNYFYVTTTKLIEYALHENTLTADKLSAAQKILEVIKVYEEKVIGELIVKQEIIDALLVSFEKNLNKTDFGMFNDELENKKKGEKLKSNLQEWLILSKELLENRKKATDAVKTDLEMEKILPEYIIENNGDTTKQISSIQVESKADRMVKLANETNEAEKKIEEKRSNISVELFGKVEDYMDFGGKNETSEKKPSNLNPLEVKAWFRFFKIIYIIMFGIALLIPLLPVSVGDTNTAFWLFIGIVVIFIFIKKAFYYIAIGKTNWK